MSSGLSMSSVMFLQAHFLRRRRYYFLFCFIYINACEYIYIYIYIYIYSLEHVGELLVIVTKL